MADFVFTIDSDDEDVLPIKAQTAAQEDKDKDDLDPEFSFDVAGLVNGGETEWGRDLVQDVTNDKDGGVSIDDIIARRRSALVSKGTLKAIKPPTSKRKRGKEAALSESEPDDSDDEEESDEEDSEDDTDGFGMGVQVQEVDEISDDEEGDPLGSGDEDEDEDPTLDEDDDDDEGLDSDDDAASVASSSSSTSSTHETKAQRERKAAFFSDEPAASSTSHLPASFAAMNLSRPILRNITALNFTAPTPIQSRAIPLALLGRDILGSAVTGSGKTAAFMIPVLERLLYREKGKGGKGSASRVLVLCPTRELAVQCEAVGKALSAGMDIRFALLVGGLSLNAQSQLLRTLPDILIATPGRLIDHIRNSPSFTLDALDVLIVDEADRMLEAGFSDELNEIITSCPRSRQTMLFSATMTDSVDELVRLSLNKPVRLFVDSTRKTAKNLVQEFVRIREKGKDDGEGPEGPTVGGTRAAVLLALCRRTVKDKCIVFFRSKALAHQMRIVFGLNGQMASELHGNLTQEQRLQALQDFKDGKVQYLLATDLASRGLDIKGVETVINYDMPGQLAAYLHRIGRTARAGRKGRSITLVGEADRKMLKAAVKSSPSDQVRHRVVPTEAVSEMAESLASLKEEIVEVLKEEKEEKALRIADMEIRKGENLIEHRDEIMSRPARTWFQTEKEKKAAQDASKGAYVSGFDKAAADKGKGKAVEEKKPKRDQYSGLSRHQKRRKMAAAEDAEFNDAEAISASIRSAKKSSRPTKITEPEAVASRKRDKSKKKKKTDVGGAGGGGKRVKIGGKQNFDTNFGKSASAGASGEGARAGRRDGVGLGGKKGGKPKSKTAPKGGKVKKGGKRP